ncbi:Uncharacterized protein ALO39_05535 [Pseudomonas syringae pv. lapsa]|nr:Uncharacterized protein ALO39_05535 [Pseudomonas syringae pv. lapsa]
MPGIHRPERSVVPESGSSTLVLAGPGFGNFDHAAAQTDFAVVEHHRLAGSDGALRVIECGAITVCGFFQRAWLVALTITDLRGEPARAAQIDRVDPIDFRRDQRTGKQPGVIVTLTDNQFVVVQVLDQHVPRIIAGILETADAQTLTLADGVVHQAAVTTDDFTFGGLDFAGLGGQVLTQKISEAAFANEADSGGILLLGSGQAVLFGNGAHFRFFQLANREQGAGNLLAANGVQEVALILVRVQALEQLGTSIDITAAYVMACSNKVGAEHQCVVEKRLELDFAVTQDVRVRRAPGLVLFKEVLEDVVPVLGREVGRVQLDADLVAHGLGICQVFAGGAVFRSVVFFPVLHEQAFHLITLLHEQYGGNGRVHAAGHADYDALHF